MRAFNCPKDEKSIMDDPQQGQLLAVGGGGHTIEGTYKGINNYVKTYTDNNTDLPSSSSSLPVRY